MQSACVGISNTPSALKVHRDKTTELLHISQSAISRHMAQPEDKGIRSWALFPMWQNKRESPRLAKIHRINFFINKAKGTAPNHFDSRAVPFMVIEVVNEEQINVWSFLVPDQRLRQHFQHVDHLRVAQNLNQCRRVHAGRFELLDDWICFLLAGRMRHHARFRTASSVEGFFQQMRIQYAAFIQNMRILVRDHFRLCVTGIPLHSLDVTAIELQLVSCSASPAVSSSRFSPVVRSETA